MMTIMGIGMGTTLHEIHAEDCTTFSPSADERVILVPVQNWQHSSPQSLPPPPTIPTPSSAKPSLLYSTPNVLPLTQADPHAIYFR